MAQVPATRRNGGGTMAPRRENPLERMQRDFDTLFGRLFGGWLAPAEQEFGQLRLWDFDVKETDYGLAISARRNAPEEGKYYWRITQFLMPTYTMIPAQPGGTLSFTSAVPIDDTTMVGMTIDWRPDRPLTEDEKRRVRELSGGGSGPAPAVRPAAASSHAATGSVLQNARLVAEELVEEEAA